jgi:hypothetical protein
VVLVEAVEPVVGGAELLMTVAAGVEGGAELDATTVEGVGLEGGAELDITTGAAGSPVST